MLQTYLKMTTAIALVSVLAACDNDNGQKVSSGTLRPPVEDGASSGPVDHGTASGGTGTDVTTSDVVVVPPEPDNTNDGSGTTGGKPDEEQAELPIVPDVEPDEGPVELPGVVSGAAEIMGPAVDQAAIAARAEALVQQLSFDEKVQLTGTRDSRGWAGYIDGIPRLGIPDLILSDATTGVAFWNGVRATSYPAPVAIAASWDPNLSHFAADMIAKEMVVAGVNFGLGAGVNLVRDPRYGRIFEYFGEDPLLSGVLHRRRVEATQENGVLATVKHFVGNEQETMRVGQGRTSTGAQVSGGNSTIDERTLRQRYLKPFEIVVKGPNPPANIMCAYSAINDHQACENAALLTGVVKNEWGYKGQIQSDWDATAATNTVKAANAGLDEFQVSNRMAGLANAVRNGNVSQDRLTDMARRKIHAVLQTKATMSNAGTDELKLNKRFEAERGRAAGGAKWGREHAEYTGTGFLERFESSGAQVSVDVASGLPAGRYTLHIRYASGIGIDGRAQTRELEVALNGTAFGNISLPTTNSWKVWTNAKLDIDVPENLTSLRLASRGNGIVNIDALAITPIGADFPDSVSDGPKVDFDAGRVAAQKIAEESFVLLKNRGHLTADALLPLDPAKNLKIAVVGGHADRAVIAGGGAGNTGEGELGTFTGNLTLVQRQWDITHTTLRTDNWLWKRVKDPIVASLKKAAPNAIVTYNGYDLNPERDGFRRYTTDEIKAAAAAAKDADVAVVVVTQIATEATDQETLTLANPNNQTALLEAVAAANPNTIVLVATANPILMPWKDKVAGIVQIWFPGDAAGPAIANILFGKVNPSGKLPLTFPAAENQTPTGGGSFASNPIYKEGLLAGYSWYDANDQVPLFEFGYGLSYSTYEYSALEIVTAEDGSKKASFKVKNTGQRDGQEIAQVYMGFPAKYQEPPKRLVNWAKVALKAGETKTVTVDIPVDRQSFWNVDKKGWELMEGGSVIVGSSSRDIRLKQADQITLVH